MHRNCHIKNKKFKISSPKTAGMPKVAEVVTVYGLIARFIPVNFLVKYKINKRQTPKKPLKTKNLIGFRLSIAKIKDVKIKITSKMTALYFKKDIKSPNIIVMILILIKCKKFENAAHKGGCFIYYLFFVLSSSPTTITSSKSNLSLSSIISSFLKSLL